MKPDNVQRALMYVRAAKKELPGLVPEGITGSDFLAVQHLGSVAMAALAELLQQMAEEHPLGFVNLEGFGYDDDQSV